LKKLKNFNLPFTGCKTNEMKKRAYARIDFKNCDTQYEYTICDWPDVNNYTELVKLTAEDLDEEGFVSWKQNGYLPEVKISIVMMTEEEFSEWFRDNVEANA
jgi:hypothetical protein